MSDEVTNIENNAPAALGAFGVAVKKDDDFMEQCQKASYLPRLQLCTSQSKLVKSKKVELDTFASIVNDEDYKVLGESVDVLAVSWRQKALDTNAGLSYYDSNKPEFIDIQTRADTVTNSKCMYGPEFLVWCAETQSLMTFFFGSKSLRFEVKKMVRLYKEGKPITFLPNNVTLRNGDEYTVAQVTECASIVAPPSAEVAEALKSEIEKFNNPKDSTASEAQPASKEKQSGNRAR